MTRDPSDDEPPRAHLSRRAFLGYSGTTLAMLAVPGCRSSGRDAVASALAAIDVRNLKVGGEEVVVQRPEDLVDLRFGFVNLLASGHRTRLTRTGAPALIVMTLPPQHLGERSFIDDLDEVPVAVDQALPSRVVFYVPDEVDELGLSSAALLGLARQYAMVTHANAAPAVDAELPEAGAGPVSGARGAPVAPLALETALELPWRLQLSPNPYGRWAHALDPVPSSRGRVELWHTRLGVAPAVAGAPTDERSRPLRTVRALWHRDPGVDPLASDSSNHDAPLTPPVRSQIVKGTGDWRPLIDRVPYGPPTPMQLEHLMLSALGGWLDGRVDFRAGMGVHHWVHRAVMGRDAYVEVAFRGFAYPYGHEIQIVKVTERVMQHGWGPAYLKTRYLPVVVEHTRGYDGTGDIKALRQMPLASWTFVDDQLPEIKLENESDLYDAMVPASKATGTPLLFNVETVDRDGNKLVLRTPILWVPYDKATPSDTEALQRKWQTATTSAGAPLGKLESHGQTMSVATAHKPGDTSFTTQALTFAATAIRADLFEAGRVGFQPVLAEAAVVVDAIKAIASTAPAQVVSYCEAYLEQGFDQLKNPRELMMELKDAATRPFEAKFREATDKVGGFLSPDLSVRGLSRLVGPITDLATDVTGNPAKLFPSGVDPLAAAKLFGCLDLQSILKPDVDFARMAPKFVTDALDAKRYIGMIQKIIDDLGSLDAGQVADGICKRIKEAFLAAAAHLTEAVRKQIEPWIAKVQQQITQLVKIAHQVVATLETLPALIKQGEQVVKQKLDELLARGWVDGLRALRDELLTSKAGPYIYPHVPELEVGIREVCGVLEQVADVSASVKGALLAFANGLDLVKNGQVNLEWKPELQSFAVFRVDPGGGLTLKAAIRARAHGGSPAGADLLCSLDKFSLLLLSATDPFVTLSFEKLQFRQKMGKKPEIDVVFKEIRFGGALSFIQTLKEAIPLDGFSDPPGVEISPSGLKASFSLALPPVAVGMFSLENAAIAAKLVVPFIGDAMAFTFAFSSREKPFLVAVGFLGGTGYFGLEITPKGPRMIEAQLEFGACLSMNFGVASGSVAVMAGLYFGLKNNGATEVTLSGFLRVHGVVEVLGLISASLLLMLSLEYQSAGADGGKVVGKASLEIEISISFFSKSVRIDCERKFAGANGDPTFAELMHPDATSSPWNDYWAAYAA